MRFALLQRKSALPKGNYHYFPSENQKMLCIFCGRHTGRPYGVNDGCTPKAFPQVEGMATPKVYQTIEKTGNCLTAVSGFMIYGGNRS